MAKIVTLIEEIVGGYFYITDRPSCFSDMILNGESIGIVGSLKSPIYEIVTLELVLKDEAVIEDGAFLNSDITNIVIPETVRHIGNNAFAGSGILRMEFEGDTPPSFSKAAFNKMQSGGNIIYPVGADYSTVMTEMDYYGWTFYKKGEELTPTPTALQMICMYSKGTTKLNSASASGWYTKRIGSTSSMNNFVIVYELNGTELPDMAFYNCSGLIGVALPYGLTKIGEKAFYGCSEIGANLSANIPSTVTEVGENAFPGGLLDGEVCLPENYRYIQKIKATYNFTSTGNNKLFYHAYHLLDELRGVFLNGENLGNIIYYNVNTPGIYTFEFLFYRRLQPELLSTLDAKLFKNISTLIDIELPKGVQYLGVDSLYNTSLTSLTLPQSINTIGENAIYSTNDLSKIYCSSPTAPRFELQQYLMGDYYRGGIIYHPIGTDYSSMVRKHTNSYYGLGDYDWTTQEYDVGWTTKPTPQPFTPDYENNIVATFDISIIGGTNIIYDLDENYISDILIDGESIGALCRSFTFKHIGTYTIEYVLKQGVIYRTMFQDIKQLTSVHIPNSVTSIGDYAFHSCLGLTSIDIPDSVSTIGYGSFNSCSGLTSVTIGSGITTIDGYVFYDCNSLKSIVCKSTLQPNIEKDTFYKIATGGTLYYPAGSDYSQWLSTNNYYLGLYEWNGVEIGGEPLICTYDVTTTEPTKICYNTDSFSDILYNGVSIGLVPTYTFPSTGEHTLEFVLKDKTIIGSYDFNDCSSLTSVIIPDSVTSIGLGAFRGCNGLTGELVIPDSVTSIGDDAFKSCNGLTSVIIPDSVTSIGYRTFSDCTNLNNVHIGSGVTSIGTQAFQNCTSLTSITIPDSVTSIGDGAFFKCTGLNNVHIGSGVTSIGIQAFIGCTGLTSVIIPDSVTSIGNSAFMNCSGLTSVIIGSGVTSIGKYAFQNCTNLTSIDIPDSVTSIEQLAFVRCTSLSSLKLGSGVTSIGLDAFGNCSGLTEITIEARTAPTIEPKTFYNVATGGTLYYPEGSDYSSWLSANQYYLGYYGWNNIVPEEPTYIEPEIRLYKIRLDYASDGGDKYVQIDYYGATTILEPTCTQSWVTIKKTQSGWYEEDGVRVDQHQYRITMQPTNFARNINVTFSCTDVNGAVFKDSHLMLYQSAPAEPSYVILSNNNITLDGEGDTKDVSVTYTNMGEIIMPEVPEGYEIEEVERTGSDNLTQVKYRIKKVSKNKGNFILNFTGKDAEGNTVTSEDLNVEGKGQSTTPAEVTYYSYNSENDVVIFDYTGSTAEIKFNIEGYTKPFDFHVSVNDDNYNVHLMTNELDYDDGVDYAVWKMVFESEGNDSSSAYEGNIVVTYTDANTEKIFTIPFHVRYANEGKLTLGSKEFRYDKDGELLTNYNTISVGYLNIQTKHQPTCSTWVTLGTPTQRGGTFYGIDEMWEYPISVQANEGAERTGFVRFTGLGKDGKEYAIEAVVKQEGDNTVIKVDEGYIELQSLSVALPASGGSETFQVKYYDAAEIFEPELGDTWATVTEVSRTEPADDVAWNGEECQSLIVTYQVTAQPTDSGRQMKVKFSSDINYYDGGLIHMEKDKFIVYQLAEGSTEVQGSLHVLRSSLEYTYYGSPIGWNPEVGYTDLAPSTPIISESWCRIKSYTDKTSKEYDVIRSYDLELDTNESTFSRTCNITFIGEAEDGTDVRKTITITQKGQEEIINEGEFSNYKGYFRSYDNILYSVSFITNPRSNIYGDIRLAGDSPVVVSYSESDRLFTPLRTSTCTVRVVSEHYLMNLYTGKAHGTQVILRNEDTDSVEWCGFLQPNLYNQGFTECMEEIEFEASDCLSTLQYFEYKEHYSNGRFTVTFKDIIDDIMVKCGILDSYYLTQKPFSDGFQSRNANFQYFYIPEENFFSEEGEPWKYQEVLEEICKYLGVVCFQWKDDLYFIDYDRYQANKTMVGVRWDKSDDWRTMNSVTLSNPNQIVEESYKETGADISLDDVFNKVTVNCNYYNFEDIIPDLFDDDKLVNRFENNGYISIGRWTANHNSELETMDYYRIYDHENINSRYYEPLSGIGLHEREITPTDSILEDKYFFRKYVGGNIVDMVHLNYSEANGKVGEAKDWERYLMISQLNRPWCGHEGTFHWENYNFPIMEFKNLPVIFIDNTADEDTDTPIRVTRASSSSTPHNRTPKPRPVPNYLVIKAEAIFSGVLNKEYFEGLDEGLGKKISQSWYTYGSSSIDMIRNEPALCFYLELPQAGWWNGKKWVDYKTHFEVPLEYFGENKDDKKYYEHLYGVSKAEENNIETNLFLGTTGYKIPLPKTMTTTQEMYFAIAMPKRFVHCSDSYGGDYTGEVGNAYCFIKELEMKICNRNSIFFKDEDVIYENIIDEGNVIEGEEIDLKITSDNYEGFSFSHVSTVTAEEKNTTDISFYNKEMKLVKAEEGIIERYVNQYSTPSIKENVTLDMSFTPTQLITDTYWDKDFVIIGQEIDYKYDRQRLTLLEKK